MGICNSRLTDSDVRMAEWERSITQKIEDQHEKDRNADMTIKKLLLLGAGESGKSTLFKQMITLYGQGYSRAELATHRHTVHQNCVEAMQTLVSKAWEYTARARHEGPQSAYVECAMPETPQVRQASEFVEGLSLNAELKPDMAPTFDMLWHLPAIRATYELRAQFQLVDSAAYFFERIDEISQPDYVPSFQDFLRTRVRTSGIVETRFEIDQNQFRIFDVGGQRNERRKWIHCFEGVTAVLFVAALSEYDQNLFEHEGVNRMDEALELFEETCNLRWFKDTAIILFLNKRDLFEEKLKRVPLSVCFPDYTGPTCQNGDPFHKVLESSLEFIRLEFDSLNHASKKEIYVHATTATDTELVRVVFNAVKDIIIKRSLRESGLMM